MKTSTGRMYLAHLLAWMALAGCGGGAATQDPIAGGGSSTPAPSPAPGTGPNGTLTIAWAANSETDLGGYKVYYGTSSGAYAQAPGGGVNVGRVSELTISGLQRGVTYYVAVSAYDQSGNESGYSAQVSGVAQ